MASERYNVQLTRSAEKDLRRLRHWTTRALAALAHLETEPYRGHGLAGRLRDVRSLEFSLPDGAYRAAYICGFARSFDSAPDVWRVKRELVRRL